MKKKRIKPLRYKYGILRDEEGEKLLDVSDADAILADKINELIAHINKEDA